MQRHNTIFWGISRGCGRAWFLTDSVVKWWKFQMMFKWLKLQSWLWTKTEGTLFREDNLAKEYRARSRQKKPQPDGPRCLEAQVQSTVWWLGYLGVHN